MKSKSPQQISCSPIHLSSRFIHAHLCACACVRRYSCIDAHASVFEPIHAYAYVCMYTCIYIYVYLCTFIYTCVLYIYIYMYMYMHMYVCMYACMYVCIYEQVLTTFTHRFVLPSSQRRPPSSAQGPTGAGGARIHGLAKRARCAPAPTASLSGLQLRGLHHGFGKHLYE